MLTLNPGHLTEAELVSLDDHARAMERQASLLANGHVQLADLVEAEDWGTALALQAQLAGLAELHRDTTWDHRALFAQAWLYDDDQGTPPPPPAGTDIPAGVNPTVWLIDQVRAAVLEAQGENYRGALGDTFLVELPTGPLPAFSLGVKASRDTADVTWVGEATLRLVGRGTGATVIQPMHDSPGWGTSIGLSGGGLWGGRVEFEDLDVIATGGSAVNSMVAWGQDVVAPYKALLFRRVRFLDHPRLPAGQGCVRPVSVNQVAIWFEDCTWIMPESKEHGWYRRNGYGGPGAGPTGMRGCVVIAVGGQVCQDVGRPSEGPRVVRHLVVIEGNDLTGYHRHPGRAGSAITVAGSGCDWQITDNLVADLEPSALTGTTTPRLAGTTYGGLVVWDGGRHYLLDGTPIDSRTPGDDTDPEHVYANGHVELARNVFAQLNPNRTTVTLADAEGIDAHDNVVLGAGCTVAWAKYSKASDLGAVSWRDNNLPAAMAQAVADLEVPAVAPESQALRFRHRDGILAPGGGVITPADCSGHLEVSRNELVAFTPAAG